MGKSSDLIKIIVEQGVIPLFFHKDTGVSIEVVKALHRAGIRAIEYTNRGEAALENFIQMRRVCNEELEGMLLGIGTVKTAAIATSYIEAGADFIISPGLVEEVAETAQRHSMPWIPGCMTPSEIIKAENMGARLIKLFPGNLLGPEFLKAIKPVFPDLQFMPTGGVTLDEGNLREWFKAGVCCVGMGSQLIKKDLLENKDYDRIEELTREAIRLVKTVK